MTNKSDCLGMYVDLQKYADRTGNRGWWPWIKGRNGNVDIAKLSVWSSDGRVSIEAISAVRGILVNGGLFFIDIDDMDKLCKQWLELRGYRVEEGK